MFNHAQRCRAISKGAVLHPMCSISCCLSVGSGAQKMLIQSSVYVLQRSSTHQEIYITKLYVVVCMHRHGMWMSKHTVECNPASNLTTYITFCVYIHRDTWRNHGVSHMNLSCIKHVHGQCVCRASRSHCATSISLYNIKIQHIALQPHRWMWHYCFACAASSS